MQPKEVNCVVYHRDCFDGFCSALAAYIVNPNIEFYSACYEEPPPYENIKGKNVLMCDFSYKSLEIKKIIDITNKFMIIDHHKTAEEELKNIPDEYKIFNMKHCGAYLTWKYFGHEIPKLVTLIQDQDLWTKLYPETQELVAYLKTIPFSFEKYVELIDENNLTKVINENKEILKCDEEEINEILKTTSTKITKILNDFYLVAYVNSDVHVSKLGEAMLKKYPLVNFSVISHKSKSGDSIKFSLRSNEEYSDVSEIAKIFGGGGHRNASGFTIQKWNNYYLPNTMENTTDFYDALSTITINVINWYGEQTHIVSINYSKYKFIIGRYLLQNRNNVQEYKHICEKLYNKKVEFDVSVSSVFFKKDVSEDSEYHFVVDKKCSKKQSKIFHENLLSHAKKIYTSHESGYEYIIATK
jgi:oligoribonuclease NrnB/cAMP/cGMP phosphodiesterase (DHH superfamily)